MASNLIDAERFDLIKRKHGSYASWAVWAPATLGPKSSVGDLSILDIAANPATLAELNGGVVMVGLNISRSFDDPFRNFHDPSPRANDFKLRFAFSGTPYYGAYMTDIIKNVAMVRSTDLRSHLKEHPDLIRSNVTMLRDELRALPGQRPTILAFGLSSYELLANNLSPDEYRCLIRLTHYSHQIGKEIYRETVLAQIGSQQSAHNGLLAG